MKHRSVMSVILLSIVTLGIYDLYWLVKVKKELNARTSVHTPSIWLLFVPLLAFVVLLIASFALSASSMNSTTSSAATTGANIVFMLLGLLFMLAIIPVTFYWFFKFSKAVSEYTHGELSTAMNFILLWLLRFIGMAIIQDKFNDMLTAGTGGAAVSAGVPYNPITQQPADPNVGMSAPQGPSDPGAQPPIQPTPPTNPIG